MFNVLQLTVDRLAATLRRSVSVEDAEFSTLTASEPFDDLDEARAHALIYKRPTPEQAAQLRGRRLHTVPETAVIPSDPALGSLYERLCVPLRSRLIVLGYLWVTLREPLSEEELDLVVDAANTVTRLLVSLEQSVDAANSDVEAGLLGLLTPEQQERERAAGVLFDLGVYLRSQHFVAFSIDLPVDWAPLTATSPRVLLTRLLKRAVTMPALDSFMFAPTLPSTFMLIGYRRRPPRTSTDVVVDAILHRLEADDPALAAVAAIGVGDVVDRLDEAWLSYEQASAAAQVARRTGSSSAHWSDRPLEAAAAMFTPVLPGEPLLPPALRAASQVDASTLEAVEAFLRRAGDVAAAAEELSVHRGTIYNRLRRFSDATGLDLNDGLTRYVIHGWMLGRRAGSTAPG
jgi:hypothetical protein